MTTDRAAATAREAQARLRLSHEVAVHSDRYATSAQELATEMVRQKKISMAHVRQLENVAYGTDKVSEIFDWVKRQVGLGHWPVQTGRSLLVALEGLQSDAQRVAQTVDPEDADLPRRVLILLCREFVKHLAAHYVFQQRFRGQKGSRQA